MKAKRHELDDGLNYWQLFNLLRDVHSEEEAHEAALAARAAYLFIKKYEAGEIKNLNYEQEDE
jgi:hypothetical protein